MSTQPNPTEAADISALVDAAPALTVDQLGALGLIFAQTSTLDTKELAA